MKALFLNALNGRKKLLPLGCFGGFNIPYYSKNKKLVKEDIFKEFQNDQDLLCYLPTPDIKSLSRKLLLSILFYANREKYLNLYEQYKNLQIQRSTTENKKFLTQITVEMLNHLKSIQPVNL